MAPVFARHLPDFSAEAPAAPAAEPLAVLLRSARRSAEPPPPAPAPAPEDRGALLREAEERGRLLGRAEAAAETAAALEAALAQAEAAADERLRLARDAWTRDEAVILAEGLAAAMRGLEERLTDRAARVLLPVLDERLRAQAVDDLKAALVRLTADRVKPAIRASGPQDLLAALARALGPLAEGIVFSPDEAPEVRVTADETVIETQLAAWGRSLLAAVEGA
ncbi:hypothetical protein [Methylobacterium oryzisoli]|uniref:hypothetical protein n=1 Tax=Methylobacterium oryzisoli TaxID=3385502 RepID=UPI003891CBB6